MEVVMNGFSEYAGLILMLPVIMCLVVPLAMLLAYGVLALIKMVFKRLETLDRIPSGDVAESTRQFSQLTEKTTKA
jgi:hypothetical protein